MAEDPTPRLSDALREHEREREALAGSLSRYERAGELGRGGLAVVYRAFDRKLRREVALKLLHPHLEAAGDARARFQQEWRAAARLTHPNIVTVHDAGEEDGRMFLVMELISGAPLSRTLTGHRYDLRTFLELLEKVARAAQYAHESGVVHRDLKPANILVSDSGEPKIADFGLAHLSAHETVLSRTGAAVGTPVYMSPEQVVGGEITPRTDVYALGAILYEGITGQPPHTGASVTEIFGKVISEDPIPPRKINRKVPADLEIVTLKSLEKDPAHRYDSALALAEDLRRYLDHRPILAHPPGWVTRIRKRIRRRPTVSALIAVLTAVLVAAAAFVVAGRITHGRSVGRLRSEARTAEREGRTSEAGDLYSRLRQLEPSDAEAVQKSVELRARAVEEDRHRRARALVEEARRLREKTIPDLETELASLRDECEDLRGKIPLWVPAKGVLWDLERKAEERGRRLLDLRAQVLDQVTTAYSLDSRQVSAYLEECWRRLTEAEAANDGEAISYWSGRIRVAGDAVWIAKLDATGSIDLETAPPGADAELLRYEEGEDRRLVARPCALRLGSLPQGSYLVVLRKPGFAEVRYPVLIERATNHVGTVRLYTAEEIGEGFTYIPAGPFVKGGDSEAYLAKDRDAGARTEGFLLGTFEVTLGEYLGFLKDLLKTQGVTEAQKYVPRSAPQVGFFWEIPSGSTETSLPSGWDPRWPVHGLSWYDADAYCRWLSRKMGKVHRLPTNLEWEKAARGADGRYFPWGNHFDWTFTKGGGSREGKPAIEPAGAFPNDESPFGVRDLAGSVREWCEEKEGEPFTHMHIRGGAYPLGGVSSFRVAARLWVVPTNVTTFNGFRVARDLPK